MIFLLTTAIGEIGTMGKKKKAQKKDKILGNISPDMPLAALNGDAAETAAASTHKKLSNKAYLKELEKLEAELVHLQVSSQLRRSLGHPCPKGDIGKPRFPLCYRGYGTSEMQCKI